MKVADRLKHHRNGKAAPPTDGPPTPPSAPNGYGGRAAPRPNEVQPKKEAAAGGRDPKTGRFGAGNTAAAGHVNPTARARAELQKALIAAVSKEDVEALARRLLADALRGQVASAELLLRYVLGKPAKAEDPDRVGLEAWKLVQAWPMLAEVFVSLSRTVHPEAAAGFAAGLIPTDDKGVIGKLKESQEECDDSGRPYLFKHTGEVIKRRVTKGK